MTLEKRDGIGKRNVLLKSSGFNKSHDGGKTTETGVYNSYICTLRETKEYKRGNFAVVTIVTWYG